MKINAAFDRAHGDAVSVYSSVLTDDSGTERLVFAKKGVCNPSKMNATVLLVNNPLHPVYDMLFEAGDFQAALSAYKSLTTANRCLLHNDLKQYRPDNVIDLVGQKENGQEKYNMDTLTNGHLAVLASCLYFFRYTETQTNFNNAVDMMDKLNKLYAGGDGFFTTI